MTPTLTADDEEQLPAAIAEAIIVRMEQEAEQKAEAQAALDDICCNVLPHLPDNERALMQIELDPFIHYLRASAAGVFVKAEKYYPMLNDIQRDMGLGFPGGLLLLRALPIKGDSR